jgi:hypothetical protein
VDDTNKLIVASIQGTSISSNPIDILTDINIIRVNTDLCGTANTNDGCEIHLGFWVAMNDVLDAVKTDVTNALKTHRGYKVIAYANSPSSLFPYSRTSRVSMSLFTLLELPRHTKWTPKLHNCPYIS